MSELTKQAESLSPKRRELLALMLSKRKREDASRSRIIPISRESNVFPASPAQQRLWFLNQFQPDTAAYNVAGGVHMDGLLSVSALERALDDIARRHEAFRTTFQLIEGGAVQVINSVVSLPLEKVDLRSVPESGREAAVLRAATEEAQATFDLERGALFRAKLLLLSEREHVLLLTLHHIISDGWSLGIVVRELATLYEAYISDRPSPLAPPAVQYVDFAAWQRQSLQGQALDAQTAYWKEKLSGAPALLELPTDRPRPATQSLRGAKHPLVISREVVAALREVGEREQATLFMVVLAIFKVLLSRYTRQSDIVVGVPVSGRNKPEVEGAIGFFINMLALRTELSGDPTFQELLRRVRETTLGAYDHQDLPFEKIVETLQPERDLSYPPLFQVMFNLRNLNLPPLHLPGLVLTPLDVDTHTSKFDLTLDLGETREELTGWLDYSTELFDASTIERLAGHFQSLLAAVAANPQARISSLALLTTRERHQLLNEWNDTTRVYPQPSLLHEIFAEQAARTLDATAIVCEGQELSYGDLNRRANQLAHYLQRLGVGPEVLVAIYMERSLEMVIALMAVLKAGGAYVPLDPAYPQERRTFILEDTRAPIVLTQEALAARQTFGSARIVALDAIDNELARESLKNPHSGATDESLAYVIYTSGSTGKPKGAMLHHYGVRNRLLWGITDYQLGAGDTVLHKTPLSFDVSVWEIFAPLLSGARLVLAKPGGHQDSVYQLSLISEQKVTHVDFVPSMLQVFLEEDGLEVCTSLKVITCAGEALTPELCERFYARTSATMYNLYGPTEASLAVTYWVCERDGKGRVIPIGRPMDNVRIYILDRQLRPVPIGVPGELYIGGLAPGRGYLNRPDLTADNFIPDSFSVHGGERLYKTGDLASYRPDGALQFLGRRDHQVKIRGMRLELGEVESVLCQHPNVGAAVVLTRELTAGHKSLVAYVVGNGEPAPTTEELRNHMRQRLPEYMVPAAFVMLAEFPLMPNGKVNRGALPDPPDFMAQGDAIYIAPENEMEQAIAAVWRQVFKLERVSLHSNFFDLGGNSLLMAQAHSKLRATLNLDIKMVELFKHPTIHSLSKFLGAMDGARPLAEPGRAEAEARQKLMKRRRQFSKLQQETRR